jgi:hypothetical protein
VFGAFSAALLLGSLAAPTAGRLADRIGAGKLMAAGSAAASLALLLTALSPGTVTFCLALTLMQLISATVLYSSAFVAIVQLGGRTAQRSIIHLTLIAGFASTLFWPLTSWLHLWLSWRQVFMIFAALNLLVCFPVHLWIARFSQGVVVRASAGVQPPVSDAPRPTGQMVFALMLVGFAVEGLALSAVLVHMVPITQALGLGAFGLHVAALFGPAQVASRFVNLLFGGGLSQTWLAVISALLLPTGLLVLLPTAPWVAGAVIFAICMGLGSGLTSIVGGTLPLELFGREGYGSRLGWCTAAKQFTSAIAPFAMSMAMSRIGAAAALWVVAMVSIMAAGAFAAIAVMRIKQRVLWVPEVGGS